MATAPKTPPRPDPAGEATPVYALVGSDSFLQLEKLSQIVRSLPKDVQRIDLDGERAELAEVFDELRSFAMFGGSKLLVLRNADEFLTRHREPLEKYLNHPVDSATLVMRFEKLVKTQRVYKLLQKVGKIEPCDPPENLAAWISARGKQVHQITLVDDAARLLASLIGNDMGRLDNELAKLALQAEGGKVDEATVEKNVAFQREQEMWKLTDELSQGRIADALERWRQLLQTDEAAEFRAVTWLGMWLEKVTRAVTMAGQGVDQFSIIKELWIRPPEIQKPFMRTAMRLGVDGAGRAIDLLAEVDYHSKTGVGDAAENVERFLIAVGELLRGRA